MKRQESPVMREIREARKRLMARCGGDQKQFFRFLLEHQRRSARTGRIRLARQDRTTGRTRG